MVGSGYSLPMQRASRPWDFVYLDALGFLPESRTRSMSAISREGDKDFQKPVDFLSKPQFLRSLLAIRNPFALLGYKWKPPLRFSTRLTITHTSRPLPSSLDALPSCALPDAGGLICLPVQKAIPSWAISSTYPPLTSGRNLLNLANSMVRYLSQIPTRFSLLHGRILTSLLVGEITYLNVLGQKMIVLNSSKAAVDLLDKRSSNYSNRPVLMMGGEIAGWNRSLGFMQYGPRFRELRKYLSKSMTRASVEKFAPLLEKETAKFVARVMVDPGSLAQHIRQ